MTGVVHVLGAAGDLPHDQSFYDAKARSEARDLINGASQLPGAQGGAATNQVTTDPGKLIATGGGKSYLAIMRFLPGAIHVHVATLSNGPMSARRSRTRSRLRVPSRNRPRACRSA